MAKFGNKPLTTEQVRWGYEHLNLTEASGWTSSASRASPTR